MSNNQNIALIDNKEFIEAAIYVLTHLRGAFPKPVLFKHPDKASIGALAFLTFEQCITLTADNEHYVITQNGADFLATLEAKENNSQKTTLGLAD